MISEVPLGAFLSGGVDSSAVVAIDGGRVRTGPVNTCSIAFADPAFDESRFAAAWWRSATARDTASTGSRATTSTSSTSSRALYDEPYADSSAIPTYRVCQLARKHVTVALSGDGGDESFGGYRRYRLHLVEERMRRALPLVRARGRCSALLGRAYPKADWAPRVSCARRRRSRRSARDSVEAYFHGVSILRDDMRRQLVQRVVPPGARRLRRDRGVPASRRATRAPTIRSR